MTAKPHLPPTVPPPPRTHQRPRRHAPPSRADLIEMTSFSPGLLVYLQYISSISFISIAALAWFHFATLMNMDFSLFIFASMTLDQYYDLLGYRGRITHYYIIGPS
jgi:hypothetical protein